MLVEAWTGTRAVQTLQQHWTSLPRVSWSTLCSSLGPSVAVVATMWQPAYRAQLCHISYGIMIRNRARRNTEHQWVLMPSNYGLQECDVLQFGIWCQHSGWNYVSVQKHTIISLETSLYNLKIKAVKKGKVILLQVRCGPEGDDRDTRSGWVVSSMPRMHFTPRKDPVPIVQEAGWAPGSVWTGGKSCHHRDSISDHPARSQSLYQLS